MNDTIRKVVISTGVVTTIAGTAGTAGSTDGTGTAARFHYLDGITTDGTNLYVADYDNYDIRKISDIATVPSSPPSNLTAIVGDGQITITWIGVSDATCYNLYCAAGTNVTEAIGTEIAFVSSPYTYTGLTNGITYSCIATACNNNGEGSPSNPVLSMPTASYTLSVSESGTGSGTVISTPSGIDCGTTCTASVTNGTFVTLAATATSVSKFNGWSGGGCSGTGACTVIMNSDTSVIATFTLLTCSNGATDYPTCTPPTCSNGATNYPTCTPPTCSNGATDYPTCTPPTCSNGATDYPTCTPPASGTNYYANYNCNGQSQCIADMGYNTGSAGPFCTIASCNDWLNQFIAGNCTTSPTYAITNSAGSTCVNY